MRDRGQKLDVKINQRHKVWDGRLSFRLLTQKTKRFRTCDDFMRFLTGGREEEF